jgi:Uma2 family endonuclease
VPEGDGVYVTRAALVVEVVSTDDETFEKFPFYAAHGVEEVIVVEPASRTARIRRFADGYEDVAVSGVLGLSVEGLQSAIRWPAPDGLAV